MLFGSGCCCCDDPKTLWRVDADGNVLWSANHYDGWSGITSKSGNLARYGTNSVNGSFLYDLICSQDESGNSYQIGGPSVPVDPVLANTQPTIDSLRCYDSSGTLLWGWSHQPTGDSSAGSRIGPIPLVNLKTTTGGISIVHHNPTHFFSTSQNTFYGIDSSGSQLWTMTLSTGTIWNLVGAGTDYFVLVDNGGIAPGGGGKQTYVYEAATGTLVDTLWDPDNAYGGARSDFPTSYQATIDNNDNVYIGYSSNNLEKSDGSAAVVMLTTDGSGTPHPMSDTGFCNIAGIGAARYIRRISSIVYGGGNFIVNGLREHHSGWGDSYADDTQFAEVFGDPVGGFLQWKRVIFIQRTVPSTYIRHGSNPNQLFGDRMTYTGSMWSVDISDPSEDVEIQDPAFTTGTLNGSIAPTENEIWAFSDASHTLCGQIVSDQSSSWYPTQPLCQNFTSTVQTSPYTCGGTHTYTAVSSGGGYIWSSQPASGVCADGCYIPYPEVPPSGPSDTFVAHCTTGVLCYGQELYTSLTDTGGSIPAGSVGTPHRYWSLTSSPSSGCYTPCASFGSPSIRPYPNTTAGALTVYVGCK